MKTQAPDYLLITPEQVENWIDNIFYQIQESGKKYDYVVGIREGGLNVSLPLACKLGIVHQSVKISFYHEDPDDPYSVSNLFHCSPIIETDGFECKPNGLIVDDLIDRGKTMQEFVKIYGVMDIAVLLWNEAGTLFEREPTYWAKIKPPKWIVFPWEQ